MKEYCVKRKGETQWERILNAEDPESAAKEFIESTADITALDRLVVVENKAFGRVEQASFAAHEIVSRPEWSAIKSEDAQNPEYQEMRRVAPASEGHLEKLRNQTNYKLLRKVISDVAVLIMSLTVIYAIIAFALILNSRGVSGLAVIGILVNCAIAVAVVYIVKNLSIVLIDISDSLIMRNNKED